MKSRLLACVLAFAALLVWPAEGTAQYFGRNKVQYRAFDFDIIRTKHFDVYYYKQEREAAMDAARIAERSYARLSRILQLEFRERKPLVLYASHTDFQQTNISYGPIDESTGAFAEAIKGRMVVPFTGSYADFDHVFTHELVHAFQFDVIFRRPAAGETAAPVARLPLWFMEGMAEYLSIGRIDPLTTSWLRDATLQGYMRDIGEMNMRDDYLSYRFGQSLWQYIGSKWGDEVVGILLQKAPRMGIERAFASTLRLSLAELSAEWIAAVRKTYLPQIAERARPESIGRKLTQHDVLNAPWFLSPALSPDGTQMVYLSQQDGFFFDLWLADAETGEPQARLVSAARNANFESLRFMTSGSAFSPDGNFVAFSAQSSGTDALYLYDLKNRRVHKKLKFELDGVESPSFSPDGRHIVFSGNSGGISDLYITDLDGQLTQLTADRHADLLPSWSPDGRSIAFSTDRGPGTDFQKLKYGNFRVALYDVESRRLTVLPHQETGKNLNPVWAPDSKSLVWVNDATGTNNLHLFDLKEQRLYRISDLLSGVIAIKDISPVLSWSTSGKLLFTHFEKAGYNIYSVDDPRVLPRTPVESKVAPPVMAAKTGRASGPGGGAAALANGAVASVWGNLARNGAQRDATATATTSYYRSGPAFRPSGRTEDQRNVALPVSVTALLDSALLALPDTASFKHRDYKVKFTPDLVGQPNIGAQVGGYGSGLTGGSYVAFSDILGNHNIVATGNVNGSLSDGSFFGAYSFLKRRANFGLAVQQLPLYYYYGTGQVAVDIDGRTEDAAANVFVRDVIRSASLYVSYPFSTFRRLELGATGVLYQSDMMYIGQLMRTGESIAHTDRLDNLRYVQPLAALVFDNSLFGWTGPIAGRRYRAQVARAFGSFEFTQGLLDFRNYWNYKRKVVFAARFSALTYFGKDANRFSGFWGGGNFLRGYGAGSFDLAGTECESSRGDITTELLGSCPIRDQLVGSSAALASAEIRLPLIKELQIGSGGLPPVDLVTFFDAGLAWDPQVCLGSNVGDPRGCNGGTSRKVRVTWNRRDGDNPYFVREPLFSYGVGLRLNILYTVLRLDYAIPLNRPNFDGFGGGVFSISLGPSF